MEMLFEKTHGIIIGLVILAIAAVIIVSVLGAAGVFEKKQVPYTMSISALEVTCLGSRMSVTFQSVSIETGPQNIDVMPVLAYRDAMGYSEANVIRVRNGRGSASLAYELTPAAMPGTGQAIWLALTFWAWSPGGCLNETITNNPDATYATLVGRCAADFIKAETINASKTC